MVPCLWDIGHKITTAQGKQGKWLTEFHVRENTGNLKKIAQVVNFLMLKIHDAVIFAAKC